MACYLLHIMEDPDRDAYRDPDLKDVVGLMPRFFCAHCQPIKQLLPSEALKCMDRGGPCWKPSTWICADEEQAATPPAVVVEAPTGVAPEHELGFATSEPAGLSSAPSVEPTATLAPAPPAPPEAEPASVPEPEVTPQPAAAPPPTPEPEPEATPQPEATPPASVPEQEPPAGPLGDVPPFLR